MEPEEEVIFLVKIVRFFGILLFFIMIWV